jgi:hypothetical protein
LLVKSLAGEDKLEEMIECVNVIVLKVRACGLMKLAKSPIFCWVPFIGVGKYYSRGHGKRGRGTEEIGGAGGILIYMNQARSILIPEIKKKHKASKARLMRIFLPVGMSHRIGLE